MAIPALIQWGKVTYKPPAWDADTFYYQGQVVVHSLVNYLCIQDHINQAPPSASYWKTPLATDPTTVNDLFGAPPTVVGSHMGRLLYAAPQKELVLGADTQTRHLMRFFLGFPTSVDNYLEYNFFKGPYVGDPVASEVRGGRSSRIVWARNRDTTIILGTPSGLITVIGGALGVTPTDQRIGRPATPGAYDMAPQDAQGAIFYFQKGGKFLASISFSTERGGYEVEKVNTYADDLFGNPQDWTFQSEPYPTLWIVNNGQLVSLSLDSDTGMAAFAYHTTDGVVKSIAKFTGADGEDKIWALVERDGTVRLESMEQFENDKTEKVDVYSDASVVKAVVNGKVTGLTHLEGKEVVVAVDGGSHPKRTVVNGEIEIQGDASQAVVGLGYQGRLRTMRIEVGSRWGTGQGKISRYLEVVVRFFRTLGGEIGQEGALIPIVMRTTDDRYGNAPAPKTGDYLIEPVTEYSNHGYLVVEQNEPLPMTVVALVPTVETEGED